MTVEERRNFFVVELSGYDRPLYPSPDHPEIAALVAEGVSNEIAGLFHMSKLRLEFETAVHETPQYRWAWDNQKDFELWIAPDAHRDPKFALVFEQDEEAAQFRQQFVA